MSFINNKKNKILHYLFEESVERYPHKIAVSDQKAEISYLELNEKSNQLAHYLIEQGVTSETLVGIFQESGIAFMISMLGILKAGAAYLPLDTRCPIQRINYLINNAQLKFILTQPLFLHLLPRHCEKIHIDTELSFLKQYPVTNPALRLSSKNLAYVIYTSGSTGNPKGVMVEHHSIYQLIKNNNFLPLSENDHVSQVSNIVFDISIFEIWSTFAVGASLVCVSYHALLSSEYLELLIREKTISVLFLPTGLFEQLANVKSDIFKTLRVLIVGGDILNPKAVAKVINCQLGSPKHIINAYGPSENTVISTSYLVESVFLGQKTIPIGKSINGVGYYILDDALQMVSPGSVGELCLFGSGVARGYLGQEKLTKEKFITYVHQGEKIRLYRTGDLVTELPDGNLDFIGRRDRQVKIRGYRIELGEIETKINLNPSVSQAVVEVIEKKEGAKFLAAYYVQNEFSPIDENTLRQSLLQVLPTYMVPQFFVSMKKFPLTRNGKIDRKKLPKPFSKKISTEKVFLLTETERTIAELWGELLSVSPKYIDIDDNFFELGGHSLMLARLFMAIKKQFNQELDIAFFLEEPTIRRIVDFLETDETDLPQAKRSCLACRDAKLEGSIQPLQTKNPHLFLPKAVLLTGATGFLGAFLVHELLKQTDAMVYCLVRADNETLANERIMRNLKRYCLDWAAEQTDRIKVFCGDLSAYHFSLSDNDWQLLCGQVDSVYHNGALVHHVYGYDLLRASNVLSTNTLLELASTSKNKAVHYISTLSAVSEFDENGVGVEGGPAEIPMSEMSGYGLTKWVSERLLIQAFERGVVGAIYRPGNITGETSYGISNSNLNHALRLIKSCLEFGVAPDWDIMIEMTPVDFLSYAIVKLSLQEKVNGRVFNLSNPHSLKWIEYVEKISQYMKQPIEIIGEKRWKEVFLSTIDEQNALFPFVVLYNGENGHENSLFHTEKTEAFLKIFSLYHPSDYDKLIKLYIDYLNGIDFFK